MAVQKKCMTSFHPGSCQEKTKKNQSKTSQVFWLVSVLQSCCNQLGGARSCLLHSSAEHLICSDEHDADDKRNGEGTNQAFTHARVFFLLRRARCGEIYDNNNNNNNKTFQRIRVKLMYICKSAKPATYCRCPRGSPDCSGGSPPS